MCVIQRTLPMALVAFESVALDEDKLGWSVLIVFHPRSEPNNEMREKQSP